MQYADSMSNYNRFVAFVLCLASEVVMSSALFDLCLNVLAIWVGCLIHRRSDAASEELRISLRQRWTAWHNIYIYIYIYIYINAKQNTRYILYIVCSVSHCQVSSLFSDLVCVFRSK